MSRFEGDGRIALEALPEDVTPGTQPMKVRRSVCRALAEQFEQRGASYHSSRGSVLWVLVEHCRVNNVPHQVTCNLGAWTIEKLKGN